MSTTTQTCGVYEPISKEWYKVGKADLQKCCIKDPGGDPNNGCDCCYDTWNGELKNKKDELGKRTEEASKAKDKLDLAKSQRDGFKKWVEDLSSLDEFTREICDQIDLIISQVSGLCSSSDTTVKASGILYCMIREYYITLDKIKIKFDDLQACIKKLDASIMVPGTGIMKCLEFYLEKWQALVKTRDDLFKQIMDIIRLANLVHEDVCVPFGVSCVLEEWKGRLKCKTENPPSTGSSDCNDPKPPSNGSCADGDNNCIIYPQVKFPVSKDPYLTWVTSQLQGAEAKVVSLSAEYLTASKAKEEIAARITALEQAVAASNPNDRCK